MSSPMVLDGLEAFRAARARAREQMAEERAGRRVSAARAALEATYRADPTTAALVRELAARIGEPPELVLGAVAQVAAHGRATEAELRGARGGRLDVRRAAARCLASLPADQVLDVVLGALAGDAAAVAVALEVARVAAAPGPAPRREGPRARPAALEDDEDAGDDGRALDPYAAMDTWRR